MKHSLSILAASLAFLTTTQAEIVEGNVTVQLKLTRQVPVAATPTSETTKFVVSTFKNRDFINQMSVVKGGVAFSKSAKLMFRINNVISAPAYFIRDKGQSSDYDVTDYIGIVPPDPEQAPQLFLISKKVTFNEANPMQSTLGTEKYMGIGQFGIATFGDGEDKNIRLIGPVAQTLRYIRSKEDAQLTVAIPAINFVIYGDFFFPILNQETPDFGLAQGTIKFSGSKVLPTPPQPPDA